MRAAPLSQVIRDAAEPHAHRGPRLIYEIAPEYGLDMAEPIVQRRAEVMHGLRNLVQNAVDFAANQVDVSVSWSTTEIAITISDDGPGFPPQVIGRIGDPFVRHPDQSRPGYEGMGLGLFIAKTLLERSGATLTFANRSGTGASVTVIWPSAALTSQSAASRAALGPNERNIS